MDAHIFTADDLLDLRRFCGFSVQGIDPTAEYVDARVRVFEARITSLTPAEGAKVTDHFLNICRVKEQAVWDAGDSLVVASAGDFSRNPNHLPEAKQQYRDARMSLCAFLGIAPGMALQGSTGTRMVQVRV
ncbi:hypothetical protein D3C72_688260 [compost metagenome]